MASQSRQHKGGRKPEPTQSRYCLVFLLEMVKPYQGFSLLSRTTAWGPGARQSQTYSPGPTRQQQTASPASPASFPPLAQTNGVRNDNPQTRTLQLLAGLTVSATNPPTRLCKVLKGLSIFVLVYRELPLHFKLRQVKNGKEKSHLLQQRVIRAALP